MDVDSSAVSNQCSASSEPQSGRIENSYVSDLVAKTVGIMEGGVHHVLSDVVLNEVEDCLKELHELFSDADEEQQSDMISEILSHPKNLHTYYKFADKVYEGESIPTNKQLMKCC